MKFEEKLVDLRKSRRMSQEELADELQISRQAVSRWELGATLPDASNLLAIGELFNVSVDWLLREDFKNEDDVPKVAQERKEVFDKRKKTGTLLLVGFACWLLAAVCNLASAIVRFIMDDVALAIVSVCLVVANVSLAVVFFCQYVKLVKSSK